MLMLLKIITKKCCRELIRLQFMLEWTHKTKSPTKIKRKRISSVRRNASRGPLVHWKVRGKSGEIICRGRRATQMGWTFKNRFMNWSCNGKVLSCRYAYRLVHDLRLPDKFSAVCKVNFRQVTRPSQMNNKHTSENFNCDAMSKQSHKFFCAKTALKAREKMTMTHPHTYNSFAFHASWKFRA